MSTPLQILGWFVVAFIAQCLSERFLRKPDINI